MSNEKDTQYIEITITTAEASGALTLDLLNDAIDVLDAGDVEIDVGYQQMVSDQARHLVDVIYGHCKAKPKPQKPEKFTWMEVKGVPEIIRGGPFTAHLLNDTMKLWEESEAMRHCIYKSYTEAIQAARYIAYHIDAKHLTKSGFTLGFRKKSKGVWGVSPAMMALGAGAVNYAEYEEPKGWQIDQLKGKANSYNKDTALAAFCDVVMGRIDDVFGKEVEKF